MRESKRLNVSGIGAALLMLALVLSAVPVAVRAQHWIY